MIIGTPREIKNHEYRVGPTPESARELVVHGHRVLVQTGAGEGIGAHDRFYVEAGAEIVQTAERSEEHTSELQSLMRISYAVFCLKKKNTNRPSIRCAQ